MHNVDFFDIRIIEATSTSITLDNGKVEDISVNYTRGAGIRALCGGSWGFTSVEGEFDIKKSIESASDLAKAMDSNTPKDKVYLASVSAPVLKDIPIVGIDPKNVPIEEKVQLLKDIDEHARIDGVSSTTAVYSESKLKLQYSSSEDMEAEYELMRTGFAVTAVAAENGVYQAGRESRFGVCGYELFDKHDAFALAASAAKRAVELLHASQPKGGSMSVVLDPELAGVFVHEAVGHASEPPQRETSRLFISPAKYHQSVFFAEKSPCMAN